MKELFTKSLKKLQNGYDVVLMSIIASSGSAPRGMGAKMALFSDMSTVGTIGGGSVEYNSILLAKRVLEQKTPHIKAYVLRADEKCDIGMVCGGEVTVYFQYFCANEPKNIELFCHICSLIESYTQSWLITKIGGDCSQIGTYDKSSGIKYIDLDESKLTLMCKSVATLNEHCYVEPLVLSGIVYVFGGGHVSQALVPLLSGVGFRVCVYEDSEKFADKALFQSADKIVLAPFDKVDNNIDIKNDDYVVILTRGHISDRTVLSQILKKHPSYVGVIGSRKKISATKEYLLSCGIDEDLIDSIHSPIGLDIGAQTPAEIAVSITAELIAHRAASTKPQGQTK